MEEQTTKIEKKAHTFKRKAKKHASKYAIALGITAGVLSSILLANGLNAFYNNYELYFRSPFQNPVVFTKKVHDAPVVTPAAPESVGNVISPTPTITPEATKFDFDALFEKIRRLESGKGTSPVGHHRYCEGIGKWNEIGYGNRQGLCFDDVAEGRLTAERWYQKRFDEGMTLVESLCYWESGHKNITDCAYAQKYLNL